MTRQRQIDACNKAYDAHVARGAAAEARQAAAIEEMRAGWDRDAEFIARWNAMSVDQAVALGIEVEGLGL